jgi:RNA polymerase sigma-70 factor (ECF subfamily)
MPLTDPLPDVRLIVALRAGDRAAAASLYRRHHAQVYRFAGLWTGNAAAAADITQDTFICFFQKPDAFDPLRGALGNWLLGVARNLARHHLREATRTQTLDIADDEATPASFALTTDEQPLTTTLQTEAATRLHTLIARLPPNFRDVLVLVDLHELSYAEVAMMTDTPLNTVRTRLFRARAALALAWHALEAQSTPTHHDAPQRIRQQGSLP